MTGISVLILVCEYQTDTVANEFVSVIYAGTQTRKSSSTFSDITFILENLKRWKPYKICFALLVFITFSHVSRPYMFWMVVTGLGSRAGSVLCGVQLLFTCFSFVLGHLGNCSGKFHYNFFWYNSHRCIVHLLYELTVHSKDDFVSAFNQTSIFTQFSQMTVSETSCLKFRSEILNCNVVQVILFTSTRWWNVLGTWLLRIYPF